MGKTSSQSSTIIKENPWNLIIVASYLSFVQLLAHKITCN